MSLRLQATIASFLILGACASQESRRTPASPQSCKQDPNDPYEPDVRMPPKSPWDDPSALPCIDVSAKRPVVLLNAGGARAGGELRFANFFHADKFWIATVNPDHVESVYFVLELFPAIVPAAHSMLRFDMKPGHEATLVPQRVGDTTAPVKVKSLWYSVEAAGPKGFQYDLVKGLLDNFGIIYRFISYDQVAVEAVRKLNHHVKQYKLRMRDGDGGRVMRYALDASVENGAKNFYNTITKNCTTEPYQALDKTLNYGTLNDIRAFLTLHRKPLPTLAEKALRSRGILDREVDPLNKELDPSWTPERLDPVPSSYDHDNYGAE
jgi:hypothetical protein